MATTTPLATATATLVTLIDPMTSFADRLTAQKEFRSQLVAVNPVQRRGLVEEVRSMILDNISDTRVGVRPKTDAEGLAMARELLADYGYGYTIVDL